MIRARAIILVGVSAAVLSVTALEAPRAGARALAPAPRVRAVTSIIRFEGRRVLLLKTLTVSGIGQRRLRIDCGGCLRFPGRIVRLKKPHSTVQYRGVNWILDPGRVVSVVVYSHRQMSRYVVLVARVSGRAGLLYRASGCLAPGTFRLGRAGAGRRCPRPPHRPAPPPPPPPPPPPVHTTLVPLAVAVNGSGSGTVTGPLISCPGTCSQRYPKGTRLALTAQAPSGSRFTGWGGACSGTGPCYVSLTSSTIVVATFAPVNREAITLYDRMQPGAPHHGFFYWAGQAINAWDENNHSSGVNTITHIGVTVGNPAFAPGKPVPGYFVSIVLCDNAPDANGNCHVIASANPQIVNYGSSYADMGDVAVRPFQKYWVVWRQPGAGPRGTFSWVTYWWAGGSGVAASDQMQIIVKGYNR